MAPAPAPTILQRRIAIAAAFCVAAFALVGLRLVDVTLIRDQPQRIVTAAEPPRPRPDIVDRNGQLLARDIPTTDIYAHVKLLKNRTLAARLIAQATGDDAARIARLLDGRHPYIMVARQLSPDQLLRVMDLGLPGLEYQPSDKRIYPDGRAAAQVLGVTDPDDHGLSGIERGLDAQMRAMPGGARVQLSLDMRVQYALAHELRLSREKFGARAAGGIVMDVNTGEILAMASLPDFDPNLRDVGAQSGRNRMVQDRYELGSVFKIFSFALALQDRTTRLDEVFPIGNDLKIGRHAIHDAERMPATLAARDIFAQSSNIGTAQIALRSGGERQRAFLASLGLLLAPRTEVAETASPLVPRNWGPIETATIGFGQGISVTPLAFVAAAATIVNGGRRIRPTFLKHPADARGEQVISPQTSVAMRALMRYVVTDGTGKKADVPGYDVGGKTGSAQVPGPHGYVPHKLLTSFCGVFPIDNPRYLVFVLLDEPKGTKDTFGFALAGYTAAPLAGAVIARVAPILGLVPQTPVLADARKTP